MHDACYRESHFEEPLSVEKCERLRVCCCSLAGEGALGCVWVDAGGPCCETDLYFNVAFQQRDHALSQSLPIASINTPKSVIAEASTTSTVSHNAAGSRNT